MTTQELYNALIRKPDLHTLPQIWGDSLIWELFKNASVQVSCDRSGAFIEIVSHNLLSGSLIRWRTDQALEELYALGKRGHILVLKKTLWGTGRHYCGPVEGLPPSARNGFSLGGKKWDSGQYIYLEHK